MKSTVYKFSAIWLMLIICTSANVIGQTFEEWKKQQQEDFQAYKDKFDEEFIKMLKSTWEEVGLQSEVGFYHAIKPDEIPTYKVPDKPFVDLEIPDEVLIEDKISIDLNFEIDKEPLKFPTPTTFTVDNKSAVIKNEVAALFSGMESQIHNLDFYSNAILFSYPQAVSRKLTPSKFKNGAIDNDTIANFWEEISSVDHSDFVAYTMQLKSEFGLNDWGYILLINSISKDIVGAEQTNLVRLMNWFLLTKAGYRTRVGYDESGAYNLFAVDGNIFDQKYYQLDGEKYFPINFNEEYQTPGSIFTYSGGHQAQVNKLNLAIEEYPTFHASTDTFQKTLRFEFKNRKYEFPVTSSKNLISYFEYYPRTDLPIFFTASMSLSTKRQLYTQLKPILEAMNELQAVNFLLRLVQSSFEYKTDQDQFNREKYMFADEIFYYPYSDCDDRAIFFATLVKDLLHLDVVALRYSRHLATAIKFSHDVPGDYHLSNGQKFVVADPTYVNAPVGLTMTSYRDERPEIIRF